MVLKIIYLKFHSNLPRANELKELAINIRYAIVNKNIDIKKQIIKIEGY